MPTTEHIHLPLYTDEETPDLSSTSHYNEAMEILDNSAVYVDEMLDRERVQREARDAELDGLISTEELARTSADTALGARIDNAETEISANSADLTGIKGLTYGSEHVQFIENENGSYTSPALEEIAEQVANASGGYTIIDFGTDGLGESSFALMAEKWPQVMLRRTDANNTKTMLMPLSKTNDGLYRFTAAVAYSQGYNGTDTDYFETSASNTTGTYRNTSPTWANLQARPFKYIDSHGGLTATSGALKVSVDGETIKVNASGALQAVSAGITGAITWGELEAAAPPA